jgi:class 3 adenylate cyclase
MAEELKNEHTGNLFYTEERKAASGHRGSAMTHRQALSMGMDGAPAARSAKTYKIIKSQFSDVMARNGTEKLRYIIGDFFQQLMHLIVDGGGDIIRLAGDALIAVFSMHNLSKMAQVVHDAATVAMESVVFLDGNVFHGKKVHLRVGLDMGTINIMVLGSKEQGWQYVVAGEPFAQLDSLLEDGVSGDILVTKKFWEAIKRSKRKEWTAEQLSGSRGTNPHFKLNYTGKLVRTKHEYPDREALLEDSAQSMENLRVFVPGCVLHACEAEGSGWFSYIQRVTMLFIKAGVDKAKLMDAQGGDGLLAHLQAVYNLMQEVVLRYDGVIKEFTVDDKGLVLMAAMGVPPATGDNQPEKACLAALEVVEVLREGAGCPAYVGISTGMVFTASVGTGRRELAMVGDAVNKAARLMSMAFKRFGPEEESKILVADTAYEDAKFRIEFEYWDTIKVKNKEETISCYVPKAPMQGGYAVMLPGNVDMVQRHSMSGDNVAEVATRRVERLARGEGGGLLLIEGLPGLGKSFLLTGLMHQWEHTFAPDNIKFICDRAHQQDLLPVRGTGGGGSNFNSTLDGDIGELQRSLGSNGSIRGQGLRKGSLDKAQQQAEEHPLASWRPVLISLLLAFKNHVMSYAVACDRAFPPSRNSISSGGSSPSHQHRRNDSRFSSVGSTAVTLNAIEDTVAVPSGHVRFRDTSWIPPPTQEAPRSPGPNRHRGHRRSSSRSSALSSKRSMLSMYSGGDPDTCIMDSLDSISRHMSEMPVWAGAFGAYKEGGGSKDTRWSRGMFLHFFFDQVCGGEH